MNIARLLKLKHLNGDFDSLSDREKELILIMGDAIIINQSNVTTFYDSRDKNAIIHIVDGGNNIWCSRDYVWSIYERKYKMEYADIKYLLERMFKICLNIDNLHVLGGINTTTLL